MLQIRLICFFLAFQYSVHQAQTLASVASSKVWEHLLPRVEIEWRTEWKTDITYFCQKSHSTPSTSGRGKSASWRNNGPSNFPVEIQLQFLLWDPLGPPRGVPGGSQRVPGGPRGGIKVSVQGESCSE